MDLRETLEKARRLRIHPAYLLPRLNEGPPQAQVRGADAPDRRPGGVTGRARSGLDHVVSGLGDLARGDLNGAKADFASGSDRLRRGFTAADTRQHYGQAFGGPHTFQPGSGVESLADLRRQQRALKTSIRRQPHTPPREPGGFYGDFGLGLGPGFNLHFDREGVTGSWGAGVLGTAKAGYATDLQTLRSVRENDRIFGGLGLGPVGMGLEANYDAGPRGLSLDGSRKVAVGPVQFNFEGGRKRPDVGLVFGASNRGGSRRISPSDGSPTTTIRPGRSYELGFDAGIGIMNDMATRRWRRP